PPQHPFSRNTASPYDGRTPFPPSATQPPPFPPSSHPPNPAPSYSSDHHRRPSDPPYYNAPRGYAPGGPPLSGQGHSRHQSASSIHVTPATRGMPPPSSPQQPSQSTHNGYGPPPMRAPSAPAGPPPFQGGRELPALPPIVTRPQNNGMSISSLLGGPPTTSREQPPPTQYTSPTHTSAPGQVYPGATHPSPRMSTTAQDYTPFRRPQTPDHPRPYETRDHRANSAGSPPGVGHYGTPEGRGRYSTPQSYSRPGPSGMPPADDRRETMRIPNSNSSAPPRPTSQPSVGGPPQRGYENSRPMGHPETVFGRRVENRSRPGESHGRAELSYPGPFEERPNPPYTYAERDRRERDREQQREIERELERRRRALSGNANDVHMDYARHPPQRNGYTRPPDPHTQPAWMRPDYEPPRPAYEPIPPQPERPPPQHHQPHSQ
ncbi:hypothetical protein BJ875DRAFT_341728, partial [Amylocarpus encephaloides]